MEDRDFNLKCAELLFDSRRLVQVEFSPKIFVYNMNDNTDYFSFNPLSDANDRNKVIEKMRISTGFRNGVPEKIQWAAYGLSIDLYADNSMEAAQIKCIEAVLESGAIKCEEDV